MKSKICLPAFCSLLFSVSIYSQSLNNEAIKAQMVKDWVRAKAYTIEYLNTVPADQYSFKPQDSIRSFAQQMLHLSSANVFLMSLASDQAPLSWASFTIDKRSGAQQKDSVMYYITSSYDYAIKAVKNSDISKWGEKRKVFETFDETKFSLLNKAFEHQTHHRGQTTIYIRMLGIQPPEEKLF